MAEPHGDTGTQQPRLELWLLRHGATDWARQGRHTGRTDRPLLPEGEQQARALAPLLSTVPFAAVLTSPLQRARRTAELAGLGEQACLCDDLREWDYGSYEGITTAEIRRSVPNWSVWSHGCPGGDNATTMQTRCDRVIEQALALGATGDSALGATGDSALGATGDSALGATGDGGGVVRVALVSHGHLLRSLAGTWLGLGSGGGALLVLGTGAVSVLGHERETRAVLRWNVPAGGQPGEWGLLPSPP